MGKSQRKQQDILTRREEILDAAERLYERESFELVTMDKIAKEAEFTKQTLYGYFHGKDEILAAVYVRAARSINARFESRLKNLENAAGYQQLDAMRGVFVEIAGETPLYIKMMAVFQLKDIRDFKDLGIYEELMKENTRLGALMANCIALGIEDKSISPDVEIQSGVMFLNAMITGALCIVVFNEQYLLQELKINPLQPMKEILAFGMRAFKNEKKEITHDD